RIQDIAIERRNAQCRVVERPGGRRIRAALEFAREAQERGDLRRILTQDGGERLALRRGRGSTGRGAVHDREAWSAILLVEASVHLNDAPAEDQTNRRDGGAPGNCARHPGPT